MVIYLEGVSRVILCQDVEFAEGLILKLTTEGPFSRAEREPRLDAARYLGVPRIHNHFRLYHVRRSMLAGSVT